MAHKPEDDYWFVSEKKVFNFDDDSNVATNNEDLLKSIRSDRVSGGPEFIFQTDDTFNGTFQRSRVPIDLVISKNNIDKLIRDDFRNTIYYDSSAQYEVKSIILGNPMDVSGYKSLNSKIELLDAAINSADGNAVLIAVQHLMKTLKKTIIYKTLLTRPTAVQQYANNLIFHMNVNDLMDLLTASEFSSNIGITLFKMLIDNLSWKDSTNIFLKKLTNLYNNHFKIGMDDEKDVVIVKNFIALIEWQLQVRQLSGMSEIVGKSVNQSLGLCCQQYWGAPDTNTCAPQVFSKAQGCNDRQMNWIFLHVKAANHCWDEICKHFIKTHWLGSKKTFNSVIGIENVIMCLGEHGADSEILERFLILQEEPEKCLPLAIKFKCHKIVINLYVAQRDRVSLLNYIVQLPPQSEEYFLADNAIMSPNNKWRN